MAFTRVCIYLLFEKVELAGVEPASKRGSNKLSTCLAPTCFSCKHRIRATHVYLSSLFSQEHQSFIPTSLDLLAPPVRAASWQQHPGDVSFQNLVSELSSNLLSSVTQQERNYFRQLWFWLLFYRVNNQNPACLPASSTRCQNQSAPVKALPAGRDAKLQKIT